MQQIKRMSLWAGWIVFTVAACLVSQGQAWAGKAEEYKKQGEDLYWSRNQTPEKLQGAIAMYEKALAVQPDDYEALWQLARICQIFGQTLPPDEKEMKIALWEKGLAYGKRAIQVNPDGKEGHFYAMSNLGSMVQIKGKLSGFWNLRKIRRGMDRTLELDPDFPPALVARAQYLTQMPGIFGGDEKEAIRLYKRALSADPRYYIAYYYLAELYAKNGQYEQAIASLDKIIHCPEEDRIGSWSSIDLIWAQKLRREILRKQEAASR